MLLQHDRVASSCGQEGDSEAPLPAKIPATEGEGEVRPLPRVKEPM